MEQFKCFMQVSGMEITAELHKELYAKDWVVYAKRPFGGGRASDRIFRSLYT